MVDAPLTFAYLVAGIMPADTLEAGAQLAALSLVRPAWHADAECRRPEHAAVDFYPSRGAQSAPAKAVCAACPVREPCLEDALARHDQHGIWGGTSERQRRTIRQERRTDDDRLSIPERRARVAELRAEGLSHKAIAERIGVGQSTVTLDLRALARATA